MSTYVYRGISFHYSYIIAFIILVVVLIKIGRSGEIQRRREFYLLDSAQKREKEWEKTLLALPLGFLMYTKNCPKHCPEEDVQEIPQIALPPLDAPPILRFWNQQLIEILGSRERGPDLSHSLVSNSTSLHPLEIEITEISALQEERTIINNFLMERGKYSLGCLFDEVGNILKEEISYKVNGKTKDLMLQEVNIKFQGENSIGLIIEDLTLIKRLEREKMSEEFQRRLVKTITHEIRTLLNAISGSVEILQKKYIGSQLSY